MGPPEGGHDRTEPVDIQVEMQRSYIDYAMSVIIGRALPDVRDGLKPVHTRILYAMFDGGYRPDRGYFKCSRVVGDVMGTYHPHGDTALYDALVRLAQPWSMRYPLIDSQGNFGSPGNDPPAAMRYTECRLAPLAMEMLRDIDTKAVVDFRDNYDGRSQEPVVLPSRFPNLLVNGSEGIAVGMATKIPPHNLREVAAGAQWFLDNPDATDNELLAALLERGRVGGSADIRDESSGRPGQRLVIILKRDAVAKVVLNNLYKHTQLQETFGANMLALVDGVPRTLNLAQFLRLYVAHQIEVIQRRTAYRLRKAEERAHILRGLVKALDLLDEVIALIRRSATVEEARIGLIQLLDIDEVQATAILDMQLRRLAALEGQKSIDKLGQIA